MTHVAPSATAAPAGARPPTRFGGIDSDTQSMPVVRPVSAPDFDAISESPAFAELRLRFRRFVFPMTGLFFVWYLTYVLLAAYAPGFMAVRVVGSVNIGLLLGILQFASTIGITALYVRFARRNLDPKVAAIRAAAGLPRT